MDLVIGLPLTFLVGVVGLVLCYAFLMGCEKI